MIMQKEVRLRSPKSPKTLTKRQWQLLFDAAGPWHVRQAADVALLILGTRLPPTVLARVKWSDVDLSNGRFLVTDPGGNSLWYEIGLTATGILRAWHDLGLDTGYILGKAPQELLARVDQQLRSYFQYYGHPDITLNVVYSAAMADAPKPVASVPVATDEHADLELTEPVRWVM